MKSIYALRTPCNPFFRKNFRVAPASSAANPDCHHDSPVPWPRRDADGPLTPQPGCFSPKSFFSLPSLMPASMLAQARIFPNLQRGTQNVQDDLRTTLVVQSCRNGASTRQHLRSMRRTHQHTKYLPTLARTKNTRQGRATSARRTSRRGRGIASRSRSAGGRGGCGAWGCAGA